MAATTKHDLLALTGTEYRKLGTILDTLPEKLRLATDDDGISPKDILGHRAIGLSWDDAVALLEARHGELLTFVESLSQEELYGGPMKGGKNAWTTGRWAEAAGASHYRSAVKYLRQRIKASQQHKAPSHDRSSD